MKVNGRCSSYSNRTRRCFHLAWVGLAVIALVISPCRSITRASSYYNDELLAIASEPQPSLETANGDWAAVDLLARLPLRFEACDNHTPARYRARMNESTFYLSATEATLLLLATAGAGRLGPGADLGSPRNARSPQATKQLPEPRRDRAAPRPRAAATVRMQLIGANRRARVIGENQLATRTNYFIGKDASRWQTGVANYERVRVEQVYRGIDVVYYGSGRGQLEYDFKVAPGADFKAIRLSFAGARGIRVDQMGDLLVATPEGTLRHRKPVVYQEENGVRKPVVARYVVDGRRCAGFALENYDKRLPLVIDPVLNYSTYFGSPSGGEFVNAIAVDADGNAYITGATLSPGLPTTPGALQPANRSAGIADDVFIAKLNPTGTAPVYITYLGGSDGDTGGGIAVDVKGNAYVTGRTYSTDFPTTANAFQRDPLGISSHPFVAKLNAAGTALVYSTYLGARKEIATGISIAVDAAGQATVAGNTDSPRFPTTAGAQQPASGGGYDAFVARLNPDGSALVYATYLGGGDYDAPQAVALDSKGNAYVAGSTSSTDFPTTNGAYLRNPKAFSMGFVTKISVTGDKLVYSTFLDAGVKSIAVDTPGNVYATGFASTRDLVTTPGAFQTDAAGEYDAFVTKLNSTGSALVYSTFIGGAGTEAGYAIAVDSLGNAYVTGVTTSADFPMVNPLQSRKRGGPLFKSTDGGGNWEDIPASAATLESLIVDPQSPSILYALANRDILKSTNSGTSWQVIGPRVSDELVIDPVRTTTIYGFRGRSFYKSTDSGISWQRTDFLITIPGFFSQLVVDPKMPDTLYLSANRPPTPAGSEVQILDAPFAVIFKSTDGGASWSALDLGFPVWSVSCLAIDPQVPSTIYAGTDSDGLLKTTDGGATWSRASGVYIRRLVVDPSNSSIVYGVSYDNLSKSTNGGLSWIPTTLQQSGINSLAIDSQRPSTLYAGGFSGLHKTIDGGASWHQVLNNGYLFDIALDPKQPSTVYTTTSVTDDLFLAKLNTTGTALVYSTYLGGLGEDVGSSIFVDAYDHAYVAGYTISPDFPVTPNAYQTHGAERFTGIVLHISDSSPPHISGVSIKGKKLLVSGEGFDRGAVIAINNVDVETQNDATTPAILLISKKGGKQIAPGHTVSIRVRDADGTLSNEFTFTRSND